jgi:hypothetical protein
MLKRFTVARFANQGRIEHFSNDRFFGHLQVSKKESKTIV